MNSFSNGLRIQSGEDDQEKHEETLVELIAGGGKVSVACNLCFSYLFVFSLDWLQSYIKAYCILLFNVTLHFCIITK